MAFFRARVAACRAVTKSEREQAIAAPGQKAARAKQLGSRQSRAEFPAAREQGLPRRLVVHQSPNPDL